MDLEAFRALLASDGRLLAQACEEYEGIGPGGDDGLVALAGGLRRSHPPELVAAALTQAGLRRRGRVKFGAAADRMFFTPDGLEQATRRGVAEHRAARFDAAGTGRVVDLCCGIGGDLIALAAGGREVTGVERDPLTAEVARANLAALGPADRVRVEVGDAVTHDRTPYDAAFADPARRTDRGRVFDPAAYSPPWSFVAGLLGDGGGPSGAGVKVAPGIPHRLVPPGVEAEWVSEAGAVKEAALWSGSLRDAGAGPCTRRATLLPSGHSLTDRDDPGTAPVSAPLGYLYEPDGAVIRAGLVTAVAAGDRAAGGVDGALLHPRIAYVTSDRLVPTPFATAYRVEEVLPYDLKTLRAALRTRGVGALTVKKRGVDVEPEILRRRLKLRGDTASTVVVTRTGTRRVAMLVSRVP